MWQYSSARCFEIGVVVGIVVGRWHGSLETEPSTSMYLHGVEVHLRLRLIANQPIQRRAELHRVEQRQPGSGAGEAAAVERHEDVAPHEPGHHRAEQLQTDGEPPVGDVGGGGD